MHKGNGVAVFLACVTWLECTSCWTSGAMKGPCAEFGWELEGPWLKLAALTGNDAYHIVCAFTHAFKLSCSNPTAHTCKFAHLMGRSNDMHPIIAGDRQVMVGKQQVSFASAFFKRTS